MSSEQDPKKRKAPGGSSADGDDSDASDLHISLLSSDEEGDGAQSKPISQQEKKAADDLAKRKRKQDEEFKNKLLHLKNHPNLWEARENQYLREFFNHVLQHRTSYPFMPGDSCYKPEQSRGKTTRPPSLTKGYIEAIASGADTSFVDYPVLYVLSRETKHEEQTFSGFGRKSMEPPPTKITHLRLVDGDGNQMLGRLATDIADQGKQLQQGDIIQLDLYTELAHRINDKTARMPFIFIAKYTPLDYVSKPPVKEVHAPISCNGSTAALKECGAEQSASVDKSDAPVDCCPSSRYCSMHGISFAICICESIPVQKLDLAAIKEDCYFATDELEKMSNPHKRNMIYWWYATNIYSICGKGKRKELPKCLVHRIRQCYPSDEYSGYEQHCNMHNESSSM